MKKLMTLLFLGFAAFAGGGLMNEHNMTTFVNYLYHQQQVGTVIDLGTIADSPPAALPATLPTTPGAVPQMPPPQLSSGTQAATQAMPSGPVASVAATTPGPDVPATAPPPISIRWPDESVSTFRASPNTAPQPLPAGSVQASNPLPPQPDTPPPPLADSIPVASASPSASTPVVPPPPLQPLPASSPALRDDRIERATSADPSIPKSSGVPAMTWIEIERRMDNLGVVRYEILGTPGGKKKFRCETAIAGAPKFEAEHEDILQAAQVALRRVVLFHGVRKASGNAASAASEPAAEPKPRISRNAPATAASAREIGATLTPPAEKASVPLSLPPDLPQ